MQCKCRTILESMTEMNLALDRIRKAGFSNNRKWMYLIIFAGVIAGISIATFNWIYIGLLAVPLILYLCIEKTFIFPFGIYAMLLPFAPLLSLTGNADGTTLTKLLGIMTMLLLLFKGAFEKKLKMPDAAALWLFAFFMFSVTSLLWAQKSSATLNLIPTFTGLMLFYLITASYKITESEFETLKRFLLIGGMVSAVIAIYSFMEGQYYRELSNRATLMYDDREINPNSLAFNLLFPVAICIEMILNKKKNGKIKMILITMLPIMIFAIIVTGSRKNMLSVVALIMVFVLSGGRKFFSVAIVLIIGGILYSFLPEVFFTRWGDVVESGGSGRIDIWIVGLHALKKYFITGAGFGNFSQVFQEFVNLGPGDVGSFRIAHNLYLSVSVELGFIGFSLLLFMFWKHYRALKEQFKKNDSNLVMLKGLLIAMMIANFFAEFLYDKSFWMILMMIMMYKTIVTVNSSFIEKSAGTMRGRN